MEAIYTHAEDIKEIAKKVAKENKDVFSHINFNEVVFCRTTKHISGDYVLARCNLLSDKTTFLTEKKYLIEFPPIFGTLTEEQQKIVVEHELYHIAPESKGLINYDIGEFKAIIDKFGLDWLETYKQSNEKIKLLKEKEKLEKKLRKEGQ